MRRAGWLQSKPWPPCLSNFCLKRRRRHSSAVERRMERWRRCGGLAKVAETWQRPLQGRTGGLLQCGTFRSNARWIGNASLSPYFSVLFCKHTTSNAIMILTGSHTGQDLSPHMLLQTAVTNERTSSEACYVLLMKMFREIRIHGL